MSASPLPHDIQFLGSELTETENNPENALFHVLPMPLEKTVSYGSGTSRGAHAILEASHELERLCSGREPCASGIFTHADIDCSGPIEVAIGNLQEACRVLAGAGKIPVTLGGEHSLTFGPVRGIAEALGKPIGIVQIDAHADLRIAYQGNPHSHASVMHLASSHGHPIAQFGVRALCSQEQEWRNQHDVFYRDAEELVVGNITSVDLPDDFPEHVYVTYDVDGLDPSQMPATGTPVPGGLSYYQSLLLVEHALKGRKCIGLDVVELAPIEGQSAWDFTAAQIAYRLMATAC